MLLHTETNKPFRIALLGVYHESNTFVDAQTTLDDFKNGRWFKGSALIEEYRNAYHELGGAIEVFTDNQVEIEPVFYTETTPGGIISEEAYQQLVEEMMRELDKVLPVDACFVVPHGAAVAVNHPDMDGEWLSLLRHKVGNDIPIVGTLDPHANISPQMANCTQALFPYRTNPHIDQRETGRRAASFLLSLLQGPVKPVQTLWQAPLTISIEQQYTGAEPCKSLYQFIHNLSKTKDILHVEIALGFPYADVQEMGTSVIIISTNTRKAEEIKERLNDYFVQHKEDFNGKKENTDDLLKKLQDNQKPILLLDMGDNVGGGTAGDSTYLLDKLEGIPLRSLICIYAPDAVMQCSAHSVNHSFELRFGLHPHTRETYKTKVTLVSLHKGLFKEEKPRHGGQVNYDMGSAAVIQTEQGNTVLLHTKRMPPFSLAQLTSCGIEPAKFDIIVAKGVNAPIAAYKEICPTIWQVNTPGATQADITKFTYKHRRKPLYPFEDLSVW